MVEASSKLKSLRTLMAEQNVQAYIVPHSDPHMVIFTLAMYSSPVIRRPNTSQFLMNGSHLSADSLDPTVFASSLKTKPSAGLTLDISYK